MHRERGGAFVRHDRVDSYSHAGFRYKSLTI